LPLPKSCGDGMTNAYKILVGNVEWEKELKKIKFRWKDNVTWT